MDRIAYRVGCLCKAFSLNEQDAEDASQEMLTELVVASPRFNPAKSGARTFVCRVLDLTYMALARKARSRIVRPAQSPLAFEVVYGKSNPDQLVDHAASVPSRDVGLRIDLEEALAPLERRERLVAEDLKHFGSVSDVAREQALARGSVYRSVDAIRERLIESGIDE
jgi:DNA-directed RNA polymerase specialized sigma24 family protein